METFYLLSNYKHGEEEELLSIVFDEPLNDSNSKKLEKYLANYIKKNLPNLSYEHSSKIITPYVFKSDEYNLMIKTIRKNSNGYILGSNVGSYLFPIGLRCVLKRDKSIKMSEIE